MAIKVSSKSEILIFCHSMNKEANSTVNTWSLMFCCRYHVLERHQCSREHMKEGYQEGEDLEYHSYEDELKELGTFNLEDRKQAKWEG